MEERLARVGRTAWWITGVVVVVLIVGVVGWYFRVVFPPLILAGALVFLLNPVVSGLERRGLPRLLGTIAAFLLVVVILGAVGAIVYPLVANQAAELSEKGPELRDDAEEWINEVSQRSDEDDWPIHIPSVEEIEDEASVGEDDQDLGEQVATLREYAAKAFHIGIIFVIGPFLAFYLLIDLPDVRKRIEELIPDRALPEVRFIAHRLAAAIGGFFRGQLAVAFVVGVLASIGLWIIGLDLWLVVGMIAGIFNMIPLIGPWVGGVPGVLVALATGDLKQAVGVVIVMVVVQQIDNHFITPTVMRRVQLHPAAVMMALLAWGTIGGFFGLLLAVPLTATIKIIGGHLWRKWVVGVSVPGLDEPYPDDREMPAHPLSHEDVPNDELAEAARLEHGVIDPVAPHVAGPGTTATIPSTPGQG